MRTVDAQAQLDARRGLTVAVLTRRGVTFVCDAGSVCAPLAAACARPARAAQRIVSHARPGTRTSVVTSAPRCAAAGRSQADRSTRSRVPDSSAASGRCETLPTRPGLRIVDESTSPAARPGCVDRGSSVPARPDDGCERRMCATCPVRRDRSHGSSLGQLRKLQGAVECPVSTRDVVSAHELAEAKGEAAPWRGLPCCPIRQRCRRRGRAHRGRSRRVALRGRPCSRCPRRR